MQGRFDEAEPLYRRWLEIAETTLGPENPDVASGLENYVALLEQTGRIADAAKSDGRVDAIRAKTR